MKLRDAKVLFEQLRHDTWRLVLSTHVLRDHPERKFTADTIIALIQGSGRLADNKMPSAVPKSFMWFCKDEAEEACELVVKFESLDAKHNEIILVISAYRKVKK